MTLEGKIYYYCEPIRVPGEIEHLVDLINKSDYHPLELGAGAHHKLVAIHPF
ncbi:MAG: Fic family protein [Thermoanaerobacteraceae bacterium]|nr:Fic family protein [Thermoanaerobacteraceae bacterium]